MLRQRCPRCWKGKMFSGSVTMNDPCPVCGMLFQREEGYFLGAMYFSFLLSTVLMGSFYFTATLLFPRVDNVFLAFGAMALYLPLVPAVFRYSRVLWVWADRAAAPGDTSAGAYEKTRRAPPSAPQNGPSSTDGPAPTGRPR
jgi:uncharacterized protein (DUF983 family)